jgi:hypothetical protein
MIVLTQLKTLANPTTTTTITPNVVLQRINNQQQQGNKINGSN